MTLLPSSKEKLPKVFPELLTSDRKMYKHFYHYNYNVVNIKNTYRMNKSNYN